ncbi:hypothetical protein [Spiroplasma turonicum]|uniref:Transmembrane protein n=1 Tax=Spiroplasma turonicum TaxID=216946 RepID=A0A0K1P704_9MOLU|nr:hypothetical protein [Spiroplasma turonicum]AKU80083.1 hypothetical protein STURON_00837 [Spiroplasma turonicum]ALX71084.1 hypothetical protein STURO_v1c08330 [Spiroplasma turonicum]
MDRLAKSFTNAGSYFTLASTIPLFCLSVIMMSIKSIVISSLMQIKFIGEWLSSLVEETLTAIKNFGIGLFLVLIIIVCVLVTIITLINFKGSIKQRIGYFIGIVIGGIMIFTSSIPFIYSKSNTEDGIWILITGFLFTFCGIGGTFLALGSILGIIFAKTEKTLEGTKTLKDKFSIST